jgi:hypothetical protein
VAKREKNSATHARTRVDADAGVREIMTLMTEGRWVSGSGHADIAFRYGVSPATVKDWATSASRVIRLAVESDPEDIRARLLSTLETVVSKAMSRESATMTGELYPNPDLKSAVSAIAEQAKLLGLVVTKHEVAMSEEQARAKYRELTGQDWGSAPS